jgi:hypothetical protein
MSRPNTQFSLRENEPDLLAQSPSISTASPLEGREDDMKAIGATLLDALRAYIELADGNAAHDKLTCHVAANKLQTLLTRGLPMRVAHVVSTVNRRT